jgi:hypothetical protein
MGAPDGRVGKKRSEWVVIPVLVLVLVLVLDFPVIFEDEDEDEDERIMPQVPGHSRLAPGAAGMLKGEPTLHDVCRFP